MESVWDYPRPPRVERDERHILVRHGTLVLAETIDAVRVLETSHAPVFYLPLDDVADQHLERTRYHTVCEYKGTAHYWDVTAAPPVVNAAWEYQEPSPGYEELKGRIAFYPHHLECFVDGIAVTPQEGGFYGGWITPELAGPFKGTPGTSGW